MWSERAALTLLLALVAAAVAWTAWAADDAFLTFRTIDNALAGHGPVWNVGERVQAYTHPLWMLALWLASVPHGDVYAASLGLSALATALALFGLARAATARAGFALALGVLFASRSFVDYATSGLENALVHALLGGLVVVCLRRDRDGRSSFVRAALWAALLWTRLDLVWLATPVCALALARDGWPRPRALALGIVPLVAWEGFALVYYGTPVANSALAKLSAGVPAGERLVRGLHYFVSSARYDPAAAVALATLPGFAWRRLRRPAARDTVEAALALGALAQLGWVVWVGGDFMAGRFWTPPLFAAALLLARARRPAALAWAAGLGAVGLTLSVAWLSPFVDRDYGPDWHAAIDDHGVADERHFQRDSTSLRAVLRDDGFRSPQQRAGARRAREQWYRDPWLAVLTQLGVLDEGDAWPPRSAPQAAGLRPVFVKGGVGVFAQRLGPEVYVIDYHGLGDPLLSFLPARRPDPVLAVLIPRLAGLGWRTGHYLRNVPAGYAASRSHGDDRIRDPRLRDLYERVRLVASGPLWSGARWRAIASLLGERLRRRFASAR